MGKNPACRLWQAVVAKVGEVMTVTTHNELLREIRKSEKDIKEYIKDKIKDLHDDLKENHFQVVLEAIAGIQAGDTSNIMEAILALTGSVNTLGGLVAKVVTDGATTAAMIVDLKAQIDALVAQGSANAAELAALKAEVDAAVPAIDAQNVLLQTLDDAVADPLQPDLDPNAPVS